MQRVSAEFDGSACVIACTHPREESRFYLSYDSWSEGLLGLGVFWKPTWGEDWVWVARGRDECQEDDLDALS